MATNLKLYYVDRNSVYKNWELIPNKLLIVEDIAEYLLTKSSYTITNFQYIKNELEIGINVQVNQSYSQAKSYINFKYVSIQNEDELIHYYFVKRAYWRSKDCVRFELVMDVLNTFQENRDYTFKQSTKITREHKNRYVFGGSYQATFNFQITDYQGTINVGDEVAIVDGVELVIGNVVAIDQYSITLDNLNKTPEEIRELVPVPSEYIIAHTPDIYIQCDIGSIDIDFEGTYYRKIDYVEENIVPVLEKKQTATIIYPKTLLNQNWYLLYRNQNDPSDSLVNPVDCYLIPETETLVNVANVSAGRVPINAFTLGVHYCIRILYNTSNVIALDSGATIGAPSESYLVRLIFIDRDSNDKLIISVYDCDSVDPSDSVPALRGTYESAYITINVVPQEYGILSVLPPLISTNMINAYNNSTKYNWTNTALNTILSSIDSLDRTDAKNIKLIKLPYVPYNFILDNSNLRIDLTDNTDWLYTSFIQPNSSMLALKLKNLNTKLTSNFNPTINPLSNLVVTFPSNASVNDLKSTNLAYESKLYNSDFYRETLVYDSFSWYWPLEKLDIASYYNETDRRFNIKIDVTSTMNSKFMFTFSKFASYKATENFPNILTIARNNEEVLYNVPYVNYIRTGYNYEIKSKNLQNASNFIGLGLSAASIGVSLALPSVPLKVAGVVGSLVSLAMTAKSAVSSAISMENSMQQKMDQLQNQAASVRGSDDVDLMSVYSDNRLKYMRYEPTDIMKGLLYNLFFYSGYASNRIGLPNHHTRVNFDYLECDAAIEGISSIPEECLNELIGAFKNGVTYLHKTSRTEDKWDFEQKYENWELSILED